VLVRVIHGKIVVSNSQLKIPKTTKSQASNLEMDAAPLSTNIESLMVDRVKASNVAGLKTRIKISLQNGIIEFHLSV
jgi:hypothetical protein